MEKEEINKIMKETCYGSLAYCCGLENNCLSRDKVLKKLGLTKKEFVELKEKFNNNLHSLIKMKGGKNGK